MGVISKRLVNAANEQVKSPIFITTATIVMDGKKVALEELLLNALIHRLYLLWARRVSSLMTA